MIEHRGIRCLDCQHLDLQSYKQQSQLGWGRCKAVPDTTFVRVAMSRNCADYEPADADTVKAREDWVSKQTLPAWQR